MHSLFAKLTFGSLFAGILLSLMSGATAQAIDPGMGTWTLNPQKSRYKPGPAFASLVVKFEPSGEGVRMTNELVNSWGGTIKSQYTAFYDGKDYPISGLPDIDTIALEKLEGGRVLRTDKKGGKVIQTFVRTVAADGKTMTITQKGKSGDGPAYDNLIVLDKQ